MPSLYENVPGVEDSIGTLLSLLMGQSFPGRLQAFLAALPQMQGLANASPTAIQGRVAPEIGKLANMLNQIQQNLSRQFGPGGGGQLSRGLQDALTSITQQAVDLFSGAATTGQQGLQKLAGMSLATPRLYGTTGTGTKAGAADYASVAQALQGLSLLGKDIYKKWPSSSPTPGGIGFGYGPETSPAGVGIGGGFFS